MTEFLLHPKTLFLGATVLFVGLIGASIFAEEAKKHGLTVKEAGYGIKFRLCATLAAAGALILFACVAYRFIPSPDVPYSYLSVSERMNLVRSEIIERAEGKTERKKEKRSDPEVEVSFFDDEELLEEEKRLERLAEAAARAKRFALE